jgi:RCC1 and BTB domain-containing protein
MLWILEQDANMQTLHLTLFYSRFVDVAASHYNHTSAAMTQNSKVYMWGQCRGNIS